MPDILLLMVGVVLLILPLFTYVIDGYYLKGLSISFIGVCLLCWLGVAGLNIEPETSYSEITTLDTPEGKVQVATINGEVYNIQNHFSYIVDTEKYVFMIHDRTVRKYGIKFLIPDDRYYLKTKSEVE